ATFFVIGEWTRGVSSDPGFGARVFDSGHKKMPILGKLVSLGHRIGNHTMHHMLLGRASSAVALDELTSAQHAIDPFIRDELRISRAPGGDWNERAARAVGGDDFLSQLIGPVRWDVDAKDWGGSVWCESSAPSRECERASGRTRVRAEVMAQRYEA